MRRVSHYTPHSFGYFVVAQVGMLVRMNEWRESLLVCVCVRVCVCEGG